MEKEIKKEEDKSFVDKNKYIKLNENYLFYDREDLIENNEDLICPICFSILKNPINCSDNKNSHSFCKECIDKYLIENNKCPVCKNIFEYKINNDINNLLNKLSFKCKFKTKGCNKIISYSEYFHHMQNCKYNNMKYECLVKKYNYQKKEFEKCGYIGNKNEIEKHINVCANINYRCIFCNKNILQMNLEEHVEKICKLKIEKYPFGGIYVGQKNNNLREGYGKLYYYDGDRYEGEWKNDRIEGSGIFYFYNGGRYEGEWKNGMREGYGINYFSDGNKYEEE